jgi:hypothetical protein
MKRFVLPFVIALLLAVVPAYAAPAPGPNIPIDDSPTLGPANAPVTIFEFIDFQ